MPVTTLLTYGTLKRGYRNHLFLAKSKFIGEATTKPLYKLYDNGSYPCLIKANDGRSIHGEVYQVDEITLKHLDKLEGVPFLYKMDVIELAHYRGKDTVFAYFYQRDVSNFVECVDGSWPIKKK